MTSARLFSLSRSTRPGREAGAAGSVGEGRRSAQSVLARPSHFVHDRGGATTEEGPQRWRPEIQALAALLRSLRHPGKERCRQPQAAEQMLEAPPQLLPEALGDSVSLWPQVSR